MAKVLSDSSSGTFAGDSDNLDAFAALVERHLTSDVAFSTDVGDTYTISGLAAGYYLVKDQDSSLGAAEQPAAYTKFMLQMVKDINATPKSDLPTVEKKVHESSYATDGGYGTGYNDVADWSIGDKVPFKLIGTVPEMDGYSAYKYTFHDTLSAGLTLDSTSVKVYLAGAKDADLSSLTPLTADSDYTLNLPSSSGTALIDGCSFEIAFTNLAGIAGIASGKYIIVTYDATLNDTAMIGLNGNENTVKLEFSNNPADSTDTDETTPDTVIVFTYELDGTIEDKLNAIATRIYHADGVTLTPAAKKQAAELTALGFDKLPICMAKTQYSFSDDATKLGAPRDFQITVRNLKVSAGAGFLVALTGDIMTMPGLPKVPAAEKIDVDEFGKISGLF